jgi:hypothetical protein
MDEELKVMGEILKALQRLPDNEARWRVATYFQNRFESEAESTDEDSILNSDALTGD